MMDHPGDCPCCVPSAAVQGLDEVLFSKSICAAASSGDVARVKKILEKNPQSIHSDGVGGDTGYTPLLYAARARQHAVVQLLLDFGADPHRQTKAGGSTALHRAAFIGDAAIVKLLLDAGADPRIKDSDGHTALYKANQQGHVEVSKMLLEHCPGLE